MSQPLVLSLFPGIGLLDRAFEEEGFCVVRGPDLLWGGDVRRFHVPAGRFEGVIGGDPCQAHSPLANVVRAVHGDDAVADDMTPEYARIVSEAQPEWFLRENSPRAPMVVVSSYRVRVVTLNSRMFGTPQHRKRRFWFGTHDGRALSATALTSSMTAIPGDWQPAVTSTSGGRRHHASIDANGRSRGNKGKGPDAALEWRPLADMVALQGLPADFLADAPFTMDGKRKVVANGVPLPMGRAVARAVKRAMGYELDAA